MITAVMLIACVAVAAYTVACTHRALAQATADAEEQYERDFPGGCFRCSFHAYRIRELGAAFTPPADHRCPEKWGRWRGSPHRRRTP